MNDAYTIGITLALENGVSAGIEEIRRDLERLNRTVDTSISQLARLGSQWGATLSALRRATEDFGLTQMAEAGQRLAIHASAIGLPRTALQRVGSEHPAQTVSDVANSVPTERKETTILSPLAARHQSMPLIMNSIAEKPVFMPPAVPPPAMAPSQFTVSVDMPPPTSNGAEADSKSYAVPLLVAAPTELPISLARITTIESSSSAAAPVIPTQTLQPSDLVALLRGLTPLPEVASTGVRSTPNPHAGARLAPLMTAASTVAPQQPFASGQASGATAEQGYERLSPNVPFRSPFPTSYRRDLLREPTAAVSDRPPDPTAPVIAGELRNGATTAPPFSTDASIPKSSEQNLTTGSEMGHVFLDGQLVGRWMREHLTQMAARPPSGSTSFDPKLSMVWPGAPIQA